MIHRDPFPQAARAHESVPLRQLWYLPLLALAMGLMMARILAMARILDVPGFAGYSAGLLVSTTFCILGCAGLHSLLQRDMPIMAARGRLRRALVLMAQAILVACCCAACALILPLFGASGMGLPSAALAVAIIHGLSQQLFLVVTVESRSLGDPLRYSLQNLWRAIAVTVASTSVAAATGSAVSALAAEAVISLVLAGAIMARIGRNTGISPLTLLGAAQRGWRRVPWHAAAVFLGISLGGSALTNADRWMGASLLTVGEFGQYAFAGVVVLVAQSAQSMLNASVYPLLARRYALSGQAAAFALSARVSLTVLAFSAAAAIPAHWAISAAVQRWYPAYQGSLAILSLILAVSVLRISDFWSSFLMICGYERRLLVLHLTVGCAVAAAWGAMLAGRGLEHAGLADFAWLALLLSLGVHGAAAIAATAAHRTGAVAVPARVDP
jgi:O-antigen/teichoic acid export membrane protein